MIPTSNYSYNDDRSLGRYGKWNDNINYFIDFWQNKMLVWTGVAIYFISILTSERTANVVLKPVRSPKFMKKNRCERESNKQNKKNWMFRYALTSFSILNLFSLSQSHECIPYSNDSKWKNELMQVKTQFISSIFGNPPFWTFNKIRLYCVSMGSKWFGVPKTFYFHICVAKCLFKLVLW